MPNPKPVILTQEGEQIFPLTDSSLVTGLSTALSGKQDTISDLSTIRSGASAGATAYQKPNTGIPASDLAAGVIPDVSNFITKSVDDLVNYYLKSETYTKAEVQALIGAIQSFHYEIAASTSAVTNPQSNVLYLIGPTGSGADKYEEYVYTNSTWTKIGDTSVDLSGYVTTSALNTALADYTTTANLTTLLAGKQDIIVFNTAYNASSNKAATMSDVPTISTDIAADKASTTKTAAPSAVYNEVHPAFGSSQPAGGMLPNVLYKLGTLSGNTAFVLATPADANIANHYFWTFETGSAAPTITWPAVITSWFGGSAPTINASKHYEVSLLDGVAIAMEA